ncbi:hypothetical protein N476_25095 [Pseudoalteromonas luteoviolacea H33]|uniref:Uncharacterized protein n=2 Tax=Pseudoalteromonas luteoviolacea TaxID=43657 RepID=A0A162A8J0_9GAMM|nr:hypothetical protein N476_25095 [Pseudoalteromonas luteoviolacea H33]KZN76962.1 hypothetical protein N477_13975 [Pseudoalteromonas luteoviolacea H33-S]
MHFMVNSSVNSPRSLEDSIRNLSNLSAGFVKSWNQQNRDDAQATSESAFKALDHIQNEILRRRDDMKSANTWDSSNLQNALKLPVGKILKPASEQHATEFSSMEEGNAFFPENNNLTDLTLEVALNKLKHRASNQINFSLTENKHYLYIFTHSGMGQPNTISSFDLDVFCDKCKQVLVALNT